MAHNEGPPDWAVNAQRTKVKSPRRYTTHPNVVAGVTLIAYLMLASILFYPVLYVYATMTDARIDSSLTIVMGIAISMLVALLVWKYVLSVIRTEMEDGEK